MNPLWIRRLRPVTALAGVLLALLALLAAGRLLHDPFGRRAAREAAAEAAARGDRLGRVLESEGQHDQARRTAEAGRVILETRVATAEAAAHARSAPDANDPLDPARAARLRAHDRRLCELAPDACAAAAADHAAAGDVVVPPADPA